MAQRGLAKEHLKGNGTREGDPGHTRRNRNFAWLKEKRDNRMNRITFSKGCSPVRGPVMCPMNRDFLDKELSKHIPVLSLLGTQLA